MYVDLIYSLVFLIQVFINCVIVCQEIQENLLWVKIPELQIPNIVVCLREDHPKSNEEQLKEEIDQTGLEIEEVTVQAAAPNVENFSSVKADQSIFLF